MALAKLRRAGVIAATAALLLTPQFAFADSPPVPAASTLDQGLAAYRSAQETSAAADRPAAFARAERLFAAAAAEGPASAELWTNVGTAALQAEHLGTAILAYRRALSLDPDHRHAQQNLGHARTLLPSWVPRPEGGGFLDSFLAWQHAMSAGERSGAAALAFFVAAAMLGGSLAGGSNALRLFAFVPFVAWALLTASSVAAASERGGVIANAEVVARAADSRNAPARFAEALPAGTEVTIAETRGEWARIVLADGRDAWVTAAAVDSVDPETLRR
jgi:tetratricopeptide (TPR) repeat protein